jgi:hypothetical protein
MRWIISRCTGMLQNVTAWPLQAHNRLLQQPPTRCQRESPDCRVFHALVILEAEYVTGKRIITVQTHVTIVQRTFSGISTSGITTANSLHLVPCLLQAAYPWLLFQAAARTPSQIAAALGAGVSPVQLLAPAQHLATYTKNLTPESGRQHVLPLESHLGQ